MSTNSNSFGPQSSQPVSHDSSRDSNGVNNMVTTTYSAQSNSSFGAHCEDAERFIATGFEDRAAELNHLVQTNQNLVDKIVCKYEGRGLERDSLIEVGRLGLMLAAPNFEPAQGVRFSTHASWWIKEAIKNALRMKAKPSVPELWC